MHSLRVMFVFAMRYNAISPHLITEQNLKERIKMTPQSRVLVMFLPKSRMELRKYNSYRFSRYDRP
jgi:hypothetical protein